MDAEKYKLIYIVNKKQRYLRLLGEEFFNKNKNSGYFIYKNKKYPLIDKVEQKNIKGDELKIDIIFYKKIYNKSFMFQDCEFLLKMLEPNQEDNINNFQITKYNEEEENLFDYYDNDKISENTLLQSLNEIDSFSYSTISSKMKSQRSSRNSIISKINYYLKSISTQDHKMIILSGMFLNCSSLISIPDISKWDNIIDIRGIFYNCSSLKSLPDISEWNTSNFTDISCIFYNCSSLESLPDISKWNTSNFTDISAIFCKCSSLISLPDISKWNTNKVKKMSGIFSSCTSLQSLPDISIWNTYNVSEISGIFFNCSSLISLPDISIWDTYKVENMAGIFFNCSLLKSLPDISKWDVDNVKNMSGMFINCSSLLSLPDISQWKVDYKQSFHMEKGICYDISPPIKIPYPDIYKWDGINIISSSHIFGDCSSLLNVCNKKRNDSDYVSFYYFPMNMNGTFYNCSSLLSIPDISKWKICDEKMIGTFYNCSSLLTLPDISKWNIKESNNISYMFYNCSSLISLPDISKWNTNIEKNKRGILDNCLSLLLLPEI